MRIIGVAVVSLALAGCGSSAPDNSSAEEVTPDPKVAEAQELAARLVHDLRDPGSAQFRNVRRMSMTPQTEPSGFDGPHIYCGEINAKNAFGGYTGFRKFHAFGSKPNDGTSGVTIWDEAAPHPAIAYMSFCQDNGKERTDGTLIELPNVSP